MSSTIKPNVLLDYWVQTIQQKPVYLIPII